MKGKSKENVMKILKNMKKDTIYNVSKIIKYCSVKYIKCFKIYQHVITACSGQPVQKSKG